jgi:hypothetical protein
LITLLLQVVAVAAEVSEPMVQVVAVALVDFVLQ